MFDYYFVTIFFTVFIMAVTKVMVCHNSMFGKGKKMLFDIVTTLVIVASVSEWLGVVLNEAPLWTRPLHILVKLTELSVAPLIPMMCADLIRKLEHKRIFYGLLGIQAVLEILSAFTGFIFYVDDTNQYNHGTFYLVYVVAYMFGIFMFMWRVLNESRRQVGIHKVLLLTLPVFVILGVIFQNVDDSIRVIWLSTGISVCLLYVMYQEITFNVDAVTHLLNRNGYESYITRVRNRVTVYYFDVNNFKQVNDTYGHACGDFVLAAAAQKVLKVFGHSGNCYRIGGDEFCAISYQPEGKEQALVDRFYREIEKLQKKDERMPQVSVGYASYDPKKDKMADVVEKADARMYENKEKLKRNS